MMETRHAIAYGALILLNVALSQFGLELAKGNVPVPADILWAVPIVTAVLTALGMLLPRAGTK